MRPKPTKPRGEPPDPEKDARIAFCVARGLHEFRHEMLEPTWIDDGQRLVSRRCDGPCQLHEYHLLPAGHPRILRLLEADNAAH
jgi:hypothetical protein